MNSVVTRLTALAAAGLLALGLAACSAAVAEPATDTAAPTPAEQSWPRVVEHEGGTTTIPAQPKRIVSTSLSITGTLLAIDAPIIATAATTPGNGADEHGFFAQWADVAVDRGVDVLYPELTLDLEAVMAADPDLIVVSTSGADSTLDNLAELQQIAPTVVYNYGDKTWQELARELGEATGLEQNAEKVVADFDAHVAETAAAIDHPAGQANAIVYNGAGGDTAFAKIGGPHATLLTALGFDIAPAPEGMDTSGRVRQDFNFLSIENTVAALTAPTVFIISGDESTRDDLLSTSVLQNAPAVVSRSVYALGPDSFRIDYYSANEIIDAVTTAFGRG
ncbi:MAG: Fe2+-enterobactin ABC transporter substrate-binding protein [Microbacterium sp.]|jgi:iron complex transport system substrate-binding protein|nr:Fe2+-enterobactin ABC transporter substrate-binding protein [Microbacterium sp.]